MLIHAGGYSQRLPNVSVIGKAFMALPCGKGESAPKGLLFDFQSDVAAGDPMFQMLEALLMMYIDFPARMDSGV